MDILEASVQHFEKYFGVKLLHTPTKTAQAAFLITKTDSIVEWGAGDVADDLRYYSRWRLSTLTNENVVTYNYGADAGDWFKIPNSQLGLLAPDERWAAIRILRAARVELKEVFTHGKIEKIYSVKSDARLPDILYVVRLELFCEKCNNFHDLVMYFKKKAMKSGSKVENAVGWSRDSSYVYWGSKPLGALLQAIHGSLGAPHKIESVAVGTGEGYRCPETKREAAGLEQALQSAVDIGLKCRRCYGLLYKKEKYSLQGKSALCADCASLYRRREWK